MLLKLVNNTLIPMFLTLPMLLINSHKSQANDIRDFVVYNDNKLAITRLYVSSQNSDYWGKDILKSFLWNGESSTISFHDNNNQCVYDLRAVYSNGTYDVGRYNLCTTYFVYFYGDGGDYFPRR